MYPRAAGQGAGSGVGSGVDATRLFAELPSKRQAVERLPWCSLSPQVRHQTRRFWDILSPICGRHRLKVGFFNRLLDYRKPNLREY